jgi:hypothetical protein
MTNYFLTIKKTEANPNYKEQIQEYQERNRYFDRGPGRDMGEPQREIVKDILVVELTEEQYKKVKLESIKVFE